MGCWGKSVWKCDSSSFVHEWMHALRRSCPPWHRSLAESRMEVDISYCNIYPVMLILTHTHRYINNICVVCVYALIHKRLTFTCFHLLSLPWPSKTPHGHPKEVLVSPRFRDLRGRGTIQSLCADGHGAHQVSGLDTVELDGACLWYYPQPLCILYDFITSCWILWAAYFVLSKVVGWILLHNTS